MRGRLRRWVARLFEERPCARCHVEGGQRWIKERRVGNRLVREHVCSECRSAIFFGRRGVDWEPLPRPEARALCALLDPKPDQYGCDRCERRGDVWTLTDLCTSPEGLEARAAALVAYGNGLPDGVITEAFAEAENLRRKARKIARGDA